MFCNFSTSPISSTEGKRHLPPAPRQRSAYKPCSKGVVGGFEVSLITGVKSIKTATAVSTRAAGTKATGHRLTRQRNPPLDEAIQVLQRSHLNDSALSTHESCRQFTPHPSKGSEQLQACAGKKTAKAIRLKLLFQRLVSGECEILQTPSRTPLLGERAKSQTDKSVSANILTISCFY